MGQEALPEPEWSKRAIWSAARSTAPGGPRRFRTSAKPSFIADRVLGSCKILQRFRGHTLWSEIVLHEFGHHLSFCDQINHGKKGCPDQRSREGSGEWGNAIDDDHRCIQQRSFDGGCATGNDGGIGSREGIVGFVLNDVEGQFPTANLSAEVQRLWCEQRQSQIARASWRECERRIRAKRASDAQVRRRGCRGEWRRLCAPDRGRAPHRTTYDLW